MQPGWAQETSLKNIVPITNIRMVVLQLVTQWSHWTQFSHIQIGLIRTKSTDSPRKILTEASRFSKASWDKMIVEIIGGNGSMIYLVSHCVYTGHGCCVALC